MKLLYMSAVVAILFIGSVLCLAAALLVQDLIPGEPVYEIMCVISGSVLMAAGCQRVLGKPIGWLVW